MTISHASNITRPPKVSIHDGRAVTTTDDVAAYFGKQAHHVVQKVESLDCSKDFTIRNFSRMVKNKSIGSGAERQVVYYEMTKDGFVFLVMGFTGKKAAAFKEAYIAEFNRMEAQLLQKTTSRSPKALPDKLTPEQQSAIKELVKSRVEAIAQDKRAKAAITMWSALKSHFGVTYKDIHQNQFIEALSLAARIPLEGEYLSKAPAAALDQTRYNFPAETADPHDRKFGNAWITPRVILDERNRAPELELLEVLERDGYDVTGAKIRIHAMYYIAKQLIEMQKELSTASRYMSAVNDIIKNQTIQRGSNISFTGEDKGKAYGGYGKRSLTSR
ncbi:Rha family transcriptional regulator [Edwardsiella tarda]|uniref:Rha family transcriptional regulator n=1 Tax=Edwardsiella tarda TaxID=636 RepID=UPI0020A3F066|nr:Rha family transcriptional regulator [Edwardsiella tarda]